MVVESTTSDVLTLRKFVAPEFIFGKGARHLVARYARNLGGRRVLLVTDAGVIRAGWANDVASALEEADLFVSVFEHVTPNPRSHEVMAGAQAYLDAHCDIIVAVGGGSPMDCAKGIGICVANGESIDAFEGVDEVEQPAPPLICIPTTAGSAADVSQFAIISNTEERRKFAVISKTVVPDAALIDPETTTTMDPYLTACTSLDTLVHAIEAYCSTARSPLTDTLAQSAIAGVRDALPAVMKNPKDLDARGKMLLACTEAGLAFSNASLGAVHAMSHSMGGLLDLPHGECNALLLPHVCAFNYRASPERYLKVARLLGFELDTSTKSTAIKSLTDNLLAFSKDAGVGGGVGKRGVRQDDIGPLSDNALIDPCMVTNPMRPNKRDVETIFEEAL